MTIYADTIIIDSLTIKESTLTTDLICINSYSIEEINYKIIMNNFMI